MKLELTDREIGLAIAMAIMGYVLSAREWILWLDKLSPGEGLIVYYTILYGCLYVLSRLGLVVFGFRIKDPIQTFGLLMVTFAFFITVNWESPWVEVVTRGHYVDISPIHYQAEDGATWWFWQKMLPAADPETLRLLTFVATPFILCLIGGLLISRKPKLSV
jgi:hypothetical protein